MTGRSLSHEAQALQEYWALRGSPEFRGAGLPRGNGRRVLILPGLFGNDFYLRPMRDWLRRMNYRPQLSMISVNVGCPNVLRRRVERTFMPLLEEGEQMAVIGHSRGGMLGKAIASRLGVRCSHFVALGSPVGTIMRNGKEGLRAMLSRSEEGAAARPVAALGRFASRLASPRCDLPECHCEYVQALLEPLHPVTRAFTIRAAQDPVVDPDACVIDGAEDVLVSGTHSGLMFNGEVYRHLARMLAAQPQT